MLGRRKGSLVFGEWKKLVMDFIKHLLYNQIESRSFHTR